MLNFYRFLQEGIPKDEALAKAKREFIKENPFAAHPYFWAGFILNGDVRSVRQSSYNWPVIGFVLILSGIISLAYIGRRSNKKSI